MSQVRDDVEKVTSRPLAAVPLSSPAPAPQSPTEQPQFPVGEIREPRLSRFAVCGAILAPLGLLATVLVILAILDWQTLPLAQRSPVRILHLSSFFWASFAVATLLAGTTFGAMGIAEIKRSGGKLRGLPLAAFDCLLLPVLALGSAAFGFTNLLQIAFWTKIRTGYEYNADHLINVIAPNPDNRPDEMFLILDAVVTVVVCFYAGFIAWKRITRTPDERTKEAKPGGEYAETPLRSFLRLMLWVAVAICVAVFVWPQSFTRGNSQGVMHSYTWIGASQPWLTFGEDDLGQRFCALNFWTNSALAGLGALIAGIALICFRPSKAPANAKEPATENNEPRLSRLALIGAIWAPWTLTAWWAWQHCVRQYFDRPEVFASYSAGYVTLGFTAAILGGTAPFGATILGGSAMAKIKRSGGKHYGLPLAAFALLFQPLVALALFTAYVLKPHALVLWFDGWRGMSPNEIAGMQARLGDALSFSRFDIVIIIAVCAIAGWLAWRKIARAKTKS